MAGSVQRYASVLHQALLRGRVAPGGLIAASFSSRGSSSQGWSRSHAVYMAVAAAVEGAREAGGEVAGLGEEVADDARAFGTQQQRVQAGPQWACHYVFRETPSRDAGVAREGVRDAGGMGSRQICGGAVAAPDALAAALEGGDLVAVADWTLACLAEEQDGAGGAAVRAVAAAAVSAERFLDACGGEVLGAVLLPPKKGSHVPRAVAVLGANGEVEDGLVNSLLAAAVATLTRSQRRETAPAPSSPGNPHAGVTDRAGGGDCDGGSARRNKGVRKFAGSVRVYHGQMFVVAFRFVREAEGRAS